MSLFKRKNLPRVKVSHKKPDLGEPDAMVTPSPDHDQILDLVEDKDSADTPSDVVENGPDENNESIEKTWLELEESRLARENGLVSEPLGAFSPPSFTTQLPGSAPSIDVTPENDPETTADDAPKTETDMTAVKERSALGDIIENPKYVPSRVELGSVRLDVAKISADISSGEELYRRAQRRVDGLMSFVERAEVDFSLLNRLEPENRRLKARNRTISSELSDKESRLAIAIADLEDHRNRLHEKTSQYEAVRTKLAATTKSLQELETELKQKKDGIDKLTIEVERQQTAYEVEKRENAVLAEKMASLSENLENRQAAYLTASKTIESLKVDCDDFREQSETLRAEVQDLRLALDNAQKKNNSMKGEMVTLHEDIQTFKTQYEFNILTREDRITDIETQLSDARKELDIRDIAVRKAQEDVAELRKVRTAQDLERDRLESLLQNVSDDLESSRRDDKRRADRKITSLEAHVQSLEKQLVLKDDIVENANKRLEDLKSLNVSQDMERQRLEDVISAQQREIESDESAAQIRELNQKVSELLEQLELKDEIVQSAAHDVTALRKARAEQENLNLDLQKQVDTQTYQLEEAQNALLRSKQDAADLDQRYKDVAAALAMKSARLQPSAPVSTPDIQPMPVSENAEEEWGPAGQTAGFEEPVEITAPEIHDTQAAPSHDLSDSDALTAENSEVPADDDATDQAENGLSAELENKEQNLSDEPETTHPKAISQTPPPFAHETPGEVQQESPIDAQQKDLDATLDDMLNELSDTEVVDRITDFKLGLRNDII